MEGNRILRHPLIDWVPSLVILGLLMVASTSSTLVPRGLFADPIEFLVYFVVGTLAALYRLRQGPVTLGLATLVLPSAMLGLGVVPTALLAGLISIMSSAWRQLAVRRGADEWTPRDHLENALFIAGSMVIAGVAFLFSDWRDSAGGLLSWWGGVPAAAYFVALFFFLLLRRGLEEDRPRGSSAWRDETVVLAAPLLVDSAGWIVGILLCDVAASGGRGRVAALMLAFALVVAEAARNSFIRLEAEMRHDNLERLQQAHKRILGEISGMGGIAAQILTECRNVLPVQWFQFELVQDIPMQPTDGPCRSWAAGPDGILVEGEPRPDSRPEVLPGIHRRAAWWVLEKDLRAEGETLAIIRLWCDPRRTEPGAEELFGTLIPQMASSLHRARLDREAKLDPLTGIPVRRLLESRLQRAYRECIEEGHSMAVILCDIDHFKKVNDTHGHVAGDEALKLFARTLDTHRRDSDLCCRYGGEEFTLLLENTNGDAALRLAERLRLAVEALEFSYEGQAIPLTFSAGVAVFPELHIKTASELLLLADEALYEAKEQGRNRCLLHAGRGTFRTVRGETIQTEDAASQSQVYHLVR